MINITVYLSILTSSRVASCEAMDTVAKLFLLKSCSNCNVIQ